MLVCFFGFEECNKNINPSGFFWFDFFSKNLPKTCLLASYRLLLIVSKQLRNQSQLLLPNSPPTSLGSTGQALAFAIKELKLRTSAMTLWEPGGWWQRGDNGESTSVVSWQKNIDASRYPMISKWSWLEFLNTCSPMAPNTFHPCEANLTPLHSPVLIKWRIEATTKNAMVQSGQSVMAVLNSTTFLAVVWGLGTSKSEGMTLPYDHPQST